MSACPCGCSIRCGDFVSWRDLKQKLGIKWDVDAKQKAIGDE